MVYIIVIETNFKAENSIKNLFIKKTIDQIRFPIKEIISLEHFRSIFYHNFRSLLWVRKQKLADKDKKVKKLS